MNYQSDCILGVQSGCFSPQTFHLGLSWLFILRGVDARAQEA